jgi:hypothetical protein
MVHPSRRAIACPPNLPAHHQHRNHTAAPSTCPPPSPSTHHPHQVGFIANLKGIKSHTIISQALRALGCMEHRGACSADDDSGDGAGLMTQIPWKLLKRDVPSIQEGSMG